MTKLSADEIKEFCSMIGVPEPWPHQIKFIQASFDRTSYTVFVGGRYAGRTHARRIAEAIAEHIDENGVYVPPTIESEHRWQT